MQNDYFYPIQKVQRNNNFNVRLMHFLRVHRPYCEKKDSFIALRLQIFKRKQKSLQQITQQKKMEVKRKYRKKNKRNKRKDSQSEDQESHQSQHSQKLSKKSKKIQKKNYSNKEIVLKAQSVVQGDLTKYKDDYFDQYLVPINKTVNQYQEKHPLPNIDKIFSNDKPSLVFKIKDDIDENLEAYFQLINSVQKQIKIEKIGLRSSDNQQKLQISYIKQSVNNDQEGEATISPNRILTEKEYMILKHRSQSLNQLDKKIRHDIQFEDYSIAKDPYKLIQLFSLCKMSMDYQRQIRAKMGGLFKRQDPFSQYKKPNLIEKYKKLQNELMAANNIKNLQRSFSQTPIDFFNYHKANQQYEKKFQQIRFQKILTLPRFKQYVRSKKPEVDKQAKKLLHTACSGCFSQFSQISNPIQNCPQCSIRIHLHCQNIERRCHRCSYNRTSNQQKKITSYCYICNRKNEKGLMILTVTNNYPHQYAHIYCLLLHGLWTIQNKQMVGIYDKPELQNDDCTYCQKNQGLFFYSSCCGKPMHGMCAYLDGVSMKMRRDGKEYLVELNCCTDAQLQQRLKYQRRFKINFQKIIFKPKKEELYNYIVKWEKKTKEYKL